MLSMSMHVYPNISLEILTNLIRPGFLAGCPRSALSKAINKWGRGLLDLTQLRLGFAARVPEMDTLGTVIVIPWTHWSPQVLKNGLHDDSQVYFVSDTLIGDTTWCFFCPSHQWFMHWDSEPRRTQDIIESGWPSPQEDATLYPSIHQFPMFFQQNFPLNPPVFQHFSMGFPSLQAVLWHPGAHRGSVEVHHDGYGYAHGFFQSWP